MNVPFLFVFVSLYVSHCLSSLLIFGKSICSDVHGDRPRPLPVIPELVNAIDVTERRVEPSWDFDVRLFHC